MSSNGVSVRSQASDAACATGGARWPVQRILFLMAGAVTLTGVGLGAFVNTWFLLLPILTGINQLLFAAAGWCPMSLLLKRLGASDPRDASPVVAGH